MRTMYWATWVQVTARMPPSIAQTRIPARPTNTPTPNSRPGIRLPSGPRHKGVKNRRTPASRPVRFPDVLGGSHPADAGIQCDGREQEPVADPGPRHPQLLGKRDREQEEDEAAGIESVVLLEVAVE